MESNTVFRYPICRDDRRTRITVEEPTMAYSPYVLFINENFASGCLLQMWKKEKLVDNFQKSNVDPSCWRVKCCSKKATDTVLTMLKIVTEKK